MTVNPSSVRPLVLPSIAAEGTELLNALLAVELPQALPVGTATAALRASLVAPHLEGVFSVSFSVNGLSWRMIFDGFSLLRAHPLFQEPEAEGFDPAELPEAFLAALAENLLAPLLGELSTALGVQIRFKDAERMKGMVDAPVGVLVDVGLPDGNRTLNVALVPPGPGAAREVAMALSHLPQRTHEERAHWLDTLPFNLSISGGSLVLSKSELMALEVGDVLLPEEWLPTAGAACLLLRTPQCTWAAACGLEERTVTLKQQLISIEEMKMQDTDSLEVKLTFELEERTVTLAEVKALEPGQVITLTSDPQAQVTVVVNGRPVAQGRLVDVNGAVGVQLTKLR